MNASRPVVALDVDGVLNPTLAYSDGPDGSGGSYQVPRPLDGFTVFDVHVAADQVPASPFIRSSGTGDLAVTVQLNPAHAAWITALRSRADVVWATTWEHCANLALAPQLGIEPLEVAITVATYPPRFSDAMRGNSGAWKAMALRDAFEGRPLVWVDDCAWSYRMPLTAPPPDIMLAGMTANEKAAWDAALAEELETYRWREDPTLVVVPDHWVGLTAEQMAQVDAFVAEHTVPATPAPARP